MVECVVEWVLDTVACSSLNGKWIMSMMLLILVYVSGYRVYTSRYIGIIPSSLCSSVSYHSHAIDYCIEQPSVFYLISYMT